MKIWDLGRGGPGGGGEGWGERGSVKCIAQNLATRVQWCDAKSRYTVLDIPGNRTCVSGAMLFTAVREGGEGVRGGAGPCLGHGWKGLQSPRAFAAVTEVTSIQTTGCSVAAQDVSTGTHCSPYTWQPASYLLRHYPARPPCIQQQRQRLFGEVTRTTLPPQNQQCTSATHLHECHLVDAPREHKIERLAHQLCARYPSSAIQGHMAGIRK